MMSWHDCTHCSRSLGMSASLNFSTSPIHAMWSSITACNVVFRLLVPGGGSISGNIFRSFKVSLSLKLGYLTLVNSCMISSISSRSPCSGDFAFRFSSSLPSISHLPNRYSVEGHPSSRHGWQHIYQRLFIERSLLSPFSCPSSSQTRPRLLLFRPNHLPNSQ